MAEKMQTTYLIMKYGRLIKHLNCKPARCKELSRYCRLCEEFLVTHVGVIRACAEYHVISAQKVFRDHSVIVPLIP